MNFKKKTVKNNTCLLLLLCSIYLISPSCEIINPEEDTPSYIHIDSIDLKINDLAEGTASHKITDAWVYIDNNLQGTYQLPVTFPILASGAHELTVKAGILLNGISVTRDVYPFFQAYTETFGLTKDSIITIAPVVSYYAGINIWEENFEKPGSKFEATSRSDTSFSIANAPLAYEGNASAYAYLSANQSLFECSTIETFNLPKGSPVFLEMDFKTTNTLTVGIFANLTSQSIQVPVIYLKPASAWKKIYINLSTAVSAQANAIDYKIFIGMLKEDGVNTPEAYFDNIKLVYN